MSVASLTDAKFSSVANFGYELLKIKKYPLCIFSFEKVDMTQDYRNVIYLPSNF